MGEYNKQHSTSDIDPVPGLECFEIDRFPQGIRYEGIEKLAENGITIKVMNGVEVVTLDGGLKPDGTLRSTAKGSTQDVED